MCTLYYAGIAECPEALALLFFMTGHICRLCTCLGVGMHVAKKYTQLIASLLQTQIFFISRALAFSDRPRTERRNYVSYVQPSYHRDHDDDHLALYYNHQDIIPIYDPCKKTAGRK